jgi:DNA-binding HxlR family transcriptional regulator
LNAISLNVKRPSEIQKILPDSTRRVLNVQLKELEDHGIIEKKIYHQLPPKVEYSLTEIGWSLMPIIDAMNVWGDTHRSFLENVIREDPKITQTSKSVCKMLRSIDEEPKKSMNCTFK